MKEFEMTDLGLMTYFLDIEFHKSEKGLLVHQRRYDVEILKKFEMEHCNVVITNNSQYCNCQRIKMSKILIQQRT